MELILSNIGEILSIIKDNFWQIFIILSMLSNKRSWKYGIILLLVHLVLGYNWVYYMIMCVAVLVMDCIISRELKRSLYEDKIKELKTELYKFYNP